MHTHSITRSNQEDKVMRDAAEVEVAQTVPKY
jgi:hypothetical protein